MNAEQVVSLAAGPYPLITWVVLGVIVTSLLFLRTPKSDRCWQSLVANIVVGFIICGGTFLAMTQLVGAIAEKAL